MPSENGKPGKHLYRGFQRVPVDDILQRRARNAGNKLYDDKDIKDALMVDAARDMGALMGDGMRRGLPKEVAFEAARAHMQAYAEAALIVVDGITFESLVRHAD